jgi:carboxypeptidase Q
MNPFFNFGTNVILMKQFFIMSMLLLSNSLFSQNKDSVVIKSIFTETLLHGEAYENLRGLCKNIGHRLSGSENAEKSIVWGKEIMEKTGFDKVYLQPITLVKWIRGDKELAWIDDTKKTLNICALGGSVDTNGELFADLVVVESMEVLKNTSESLVRGKIVLINNTMDNSIINTFEAYGHCAGDRVRGASEAAKKGAVACIMRSLNLSDDDYPHTGVMHYEENVPKIPSVAISTNDANFLAKEIAANKKLKIGLKINCETIGEVPSFNVIGEIKGSKFPDEYITVGGHLDSWDLAEGAHDDGAGIVQSLEVVRTFNALGIKPEHSLRCVFFMNEENGNAGGIAYAASAKEKKEIHFAAIETDAGGFSPRGFGIDGSSIQLDKLKSYQMLLKEFNLHHFEIGHGGTDINPLKDGKVGLIGLVVDSQRYFDVHHSALDVFENVNKRELQLGAASLAAIIFLIDKNGF